MAKKKIVKIGDKTERGTSKLEYEIIDPIAPDQFVNKTFGHVEEMKKRINNAMNRVNKLIKLREEVASIPSEYLRGINGYASDEDIRKLIVKGCEAEIAEQKQLVKDIKYEFDELFSIVQ